jgi:hypothetical protein
MRIEIICYLNENIDFLDHYLGKRRQNRPYPCNLSATKCSSIAGLDAPCKTGDNPPAHDTSRQPRNNPGGPAWPTPENASTKI